jgi:hypothetical protein
MPASLVSLRYGKMGGIINDYLFVSYFLFIFILSIFFLGGGDGSKKEGLKYGQGS